MPEKFNDIAKRVDHLLTAVLPGKVDKLNLTEGFRFSLRRNINRDMPSTAVINSVPFTLPLGVALEIDWKYEGFDQLEVAYGLSSKFSVHPKAFKLLLD